MKFDLEIIRNINDPSSCDFSFTILKRLWPRSTEFAILFSDKIKEDHTYTFRFSICTESAKLEELYMKIWQKDFDSLLSVFLDLDVKGIDGFPPFELVSSIDFEQFLDKYLLWDEVKYKIRSLKSPKKLW